MIIQLVESLVYACANAAIRTPTRRRQRQAPRRVLAGAAADLIIEQLRIERSRVAQLRQQNADLQMKTAADQHELIELRSQIAAASRFFRAHGLA